MSDFVMPYLLYLPKRSKKTKSGLVPIILRITVSGGRATHSTGIFVNPDTQWNQQGEKVVGTASDDQYNTFLGILKGKALTQSLLLQAQQPDQPITAAQVAAALKPPKAKPAAVPAPTVTEILTTTIAEQYEPGLPTTYRNCIYALARWTAWPGSAGLALAGLTSSVGSAFAAWLKPQHAVTSAAAYLSQLSGILRRAAPDHGRVFSGHIKGAKRQVKKRKALSRAQRKQLTQATGLPPSEQLARVVFLTQYYLHGSRISATLEMRWTQVDWDEGRVRWKAMKGGEYKDAALPPALRRLWQPYYDARTGPDGFVLPVLPPDYFTLTKEKRLDERENARNRVNTALLRLGKRLKLPLRIHTHVARHSVALHAFEQTGDLRAPQQLLGHASIAQTADYISSLSTVELDTIAAKLYEDE